ncbi:MAG: flap endonuclease-1 [Thermoplasmata archaeon]|nr:flap endonuclease-1 [Thermoplasmata archaeon]
MGVDLSDIIVAQKKKVEDFKGKVIAIDGFNALYQFLSIIRQPDGTPLQDSTGRVTSHLSGLVYRTANLLEAGIRPVYVFDGKPPQLKSKTVEERKNIREKARKDWAEALEKGDVARARTKAMASSRLTEEMVTSSKKLLEKLGLPYVQAPGEGEAQASVMTRNGDAWATASQDFDPLLFGCPMLVRNLAITGRRKMPRKDVYIDVVPEVVDLEFNLKELSISQEQIVDVAILVGTDFNDGVRGIGPKKALGLIRTHGDLESVVKAKKIEVEDMNEVRRIFLEPDVSADYEMEWNEPDEDAVIDLMCGEFEFSKDRIKNAVGKIRHSKSMREQKTLEEWF